MNRVAEVGVASTSPEVRTRVSSILQSLDADVLEVSLDVDVLSRPSLHALLVDLSGSGGMDLIRAASDSRPDVRLLATAYPPEPEQIAEAARLGVERFLPIHGTDASIRNAVEHVLAEVDDAALSYSAQVERAKASLRDHQMRAAEIHSRRALALDPEHPDAYNLLGVVREATSRREIALKFYRFALELDDTHELARRNLTTASKPPNQRGPVEFE